MEAKTSKTATTIEELLHQKKLLTEEQLKVIRIEQANTGKSPESIILEKGLVSAQELAKAEGELHKIPYAELGGVTIPPEVLDLVPEPTARKNILIPFSREDKQLKVAMADPLDLQIIGFLEKSTRLRIIPHIAESEAISSLIESQYGKRIGPEVTEALEEVGVTTTKIKEQIKDIGKAEEVLRSAPVARIVSMLLEYAVKSRASDIHIEPEEENTRIRYRIDGVLQEKFTLPKEVHDSIVARIKILSKLKIDEKRLPQDGRFKIQVGEVRTDLRVSVLPTVNGEKTVIRLLKEEGTIMGLRDLGLWGTALKRFEEVLLRPHGTILVTGPTGSGKTVTLAAALHKLNTIRVNIITIEDPVEIRIPGVSQVQVNTAAGLTFASGLRSFLRQDPDIIMVGEIRDAETAELSVHAALTGHLVLSTLHTNSAAGALPRLLDMGIEPFLLASTVNLVLAQRLVRKICPDCREEYDVSKEMIAEMKEVLGSLFDEAAKNIKTDGKPKLIRGKGCERCNKTGYKGRTGIFEVMPLSDKLAKMTLEHRPAAELEKVAVEEGMVTLIQDGFFKVLRGITTIEEVLRVARE